MESNEYHSLRSEDGYSTSTSLSSGLTGFEDELNEIKHIINLSHDPAVQSKRKRLDAVAYEARINNLTSELQSLLKLNEKYKNQLFTLERTGELKAHENFEKLVQSNVNLESQLASANKQINKLLRNQSSELPISIQLEKQVGELQLELQQCWNENQENVVRKQDLNLQLNEINFELKIKQNCVVELKKKVAEQHKEIGGLKQENAILKSSREGTQDEFKHLKKSNVWYKEQLHSCQNDKSKTIEELLQTKTDLINRNRENERLQMQMEQFKDKYMELLSDHKTLESNLLRQIKSLESKNILINQPAVVVKEVVNQLHESEIKNLQKSISIIQSNLEEQRTLFNTISKENADLSARLVVGQKDLNNKQLQLEMMESNLTEAIRKFEDIKENLKQKNDELLVSKSTNSKLSLALESVTSERDEISKSVVVVRKDFQKFLDLYQQTKEELLLIKGEQEKCKGDLTMSHKQLRDSELEANQRLQGLMTEMKQLRNDNLEIIEERNCYKRALDENEKKIGSLKAVLLQVQENFENYFDRKSLKTINEHEYATTFNEYFERLQKSNYRTKVHIEFKRKLLDRLHELEDRVSVVNTKCEESFKLLETRTANKSNFTNEIEEILRLRTALQVKDLQFNQKQKRYEVGNRTLLKKIKEHMKGRSKAEKRCVYLEAMHHECADKLNAINLEMQQKVAEVIEMRNLFREKNRAIEKLQNAVTNLEMKIEDRKLCVECSNKEKTIQELMFEIQTKKQSHSQLNSELNDLRASKEMLNEEYSKVLNDCDRLQAETTKLENYQQDSIATLSRLEMDLREIQDKLEYYVKENEILKCNIINKNCEIVDLQERNARIQNGLSEREEIMKKMENEANQSKENGEKHLVEKMFLQGLLNDFKTALALASKENQDLKQRILLLTKERKSNSLPDELIINPLDYEHINSLLKRANNGEESCLGKLEDSLNSLKREMASLQKQIVEKNFSVSSL